MAAGRVRHWKHGWIPISPEAKAFVAGTGPRPVTAKKKHKDEIQKVGKDFTKALAKGSIKFTAPRRNGDFINKPVNTNRRVVNEQWWDGEIIEKRVEGSPMVYWEPVGRAWPVYELSDSEVRELAETTAEVLKDLPKAQKEEIRVGISTSYLNPGLEGAWAVTEQQRGLPITMNQDLWVERDRVEAEIRESSDAHFGITAEGVNSVAQFRRNTLTHEIGHVLHLREVEAASGDDNPDNLFRGIGFNSFNQPRGKLDELAAEEVTPRDMGFLRTRQQLIDSGAEINWYTGHVEDDDPEHTVDAPSLDVRAERWEVDSYGKRSSYATNNQFEWIAEGFTDWRVNGDKAHPTARRLGEVMNEVYGGAS